MFSFVMPMKCAVCGVWFDANFEKFKYIRFLNPINSKRFFALHDNGSGNDRTHYHFALHFNVLNVEVSWKGNQLFIPIRKCLYVAH